MGQNHLPIEELKEYGIINEDNSFSKKLSANDIKGFLEGAIIVADNNKDRITFQLTDDYSKLQVQQFHREKAIQNLLEDSKKEIQYVKETPVLNPENIEIGNTFKLKSMDIYTKSGVLFCAVGAGNTPCGLRNEEVRPDGIIVDDFDTDTDCRNPDIVDKKWEWWEQAVYGTRSISNPLLVIFNGNIIADYCCIKKAMEIADFYEIVNILLFTGVW